MNEKAVLARASTASAESPEKTESRLVNVRAIPGFTLFAFVVVSTASAQVVTEANINNGAAYGALMLTPPGAVAPVATSTILDQPQHAVDLALRYGFVSTNGAAGFNNVAATAIVPVGIGNTVSVTAGATIPYCSRSFEGPGCSSALMLGIGGDTRIVALGTAPATRIVFALNGELGYGKPRNFGYEFSGAVGAPISLLFNGDPNQRMRIVPFATPAFGFGSIDPGNGNPTQSGTRFMIGGGLALTTPTSTIGGSLGFQHIVINGGKTQYGIAVTVGL